MTQTPEPISELEMLLAAIVEGTVTPKQYARAGQLLANPDARRLYRHYLALHAAMDWEGGALTFAVPAPKRLRPPARLVRFAVAAVIVLGFAGVLAGLLTLAPAPTSQTQTAQPIATLIDSVDAVWEDSSLPTHVGSQLANGWLKLKSGTAQLEFFSGAQVTLIGPAEFGLNSEMRGFLKFGKLAAHVPQKARGFTVAAPGCAVIDLGTEFQMSVDGEGRSDVRVIKGRVQLVHDDGRIAADLLASGNARFDPQDASVELSETPPDAVAVPAVPAQVPPAADQPFAAVRTFAGYTGWALYSAVARGGDARADEAGGLVLSNSVSDSYFGVLLPATSIIGDRRVDLTSAVMTVSVDIAAPRIDAAGGFDVGLVIGKIAVIFHPDSERGGFRIESSGTKAKAFLDTTDMGFKPGARTPTNLAVTVTRAPGGYRLAYAVRQGERIFSGDVSVAPSQIGAPLGRVGLRVYGTGQAVFSNFKITGLNP